ncbi:hypothetical protein EW146_g3649 [Bondarzewia mesenterica]|uniref:F-box domain-containing protein n=1 Tax=Bondarzewia mesenterica TaxID=1095465 RepID=A0A4S4LWW9_9AGAM|nr:hypothetical protein EW146_g3649 [Bondarzewia mesenterica]
MSLRSISALPTEVLLRIFHQLDICSLIQCQGVCHVWHALIRDAADLQYKIELVASGLPERLIPSSIALPDRPHFLRQHQRAWRNLEHADRLSLPGRGWQETWRNKSIFRDGIVAQLDGVTKSLHVVQLPSQLLHVERKEWVFPMPDDICGFDIDPFQDLLVLVTESSSHDYVDELVMRVHLHSLRTGREHLAAKQFQIRIALHDRIWKVDVNVRHDILALWIAEYDDMVYGRLFVWDWRTGESKLQYPGSFKICVSIDGFAVLPNNSVLVLSYADVESPVLLLFDTTCSRQIDDVDQMLANTNFLIPSCSPKGIPEEISMEYQSSEGADGLIIISLYSRVTASFNTPFHKMTVYIPLSTLTSVSAASSSRRRLIPWHEWGPLGTHATCSTSRLFDARQYPSSRSRVAGLRAGELQGPVLRIRDFNPLRVGRARCEEIQEGVEISYSGDVPAGFWGEVAISTHLPCLLMDIELPDDLQVDGSWDCSISEYGVLLIRSESLANAEELVWLGF